MDKLNIGKDTNIVMPSTDWFAVVQWLQKTPLPYEQSQPLMEALQGKAFAYNTDTHEVSVKTQTRNKSVVEDTDDF